MLGQITLHEQRGAGKTRRRAQVAGRPAIAPWLGATDRWQGLAQGGSLFFSVLSSQHGAPRHAEHNADTSRLPLPHQRLSIAHCVLQRPAGTPRPNSISQQGLAGSHALRDGGAVAGGPRRLVQQSPRWPCSLLGSCPALNTCSAPPSRPRHSRLIMVGTAGRSAGKCASCSTAPSVSARRRRPPPSPVLLPPSNPCRLACRLAPQMRSTP